MHRCFTGEALALGVILLTGSPPVSLAQETGTPTFKGPYRAFTTYEFGAAFSDYEGVSFALEGFYRYGLGSNDLSLRGGFSDLNGSLGNQILVGGDFRAQVLAYGEGVPVDGSLTVGFGAAIGDGPDFFRLPVGISVGRRFQMEGSETTFVPYAHPVIIPRFGSGDDAVDFAFGLGVDIRFGGNLAVRASGGLGDIEGVGIGLAYIQ
jgi:hypothetical protein